MSMALQCSNRPLSIGGFLSIKSQSRTLSPIKAVRISVTVYLQLFQCAYRMGCLLAKPPPARPQFYIDDLERVALLRSLWDLAPMYFPGALCPEWALEQNIQAQQAVRAYIHVFHGKEIKCDLSGEGVDPSGYNEHGLRLFERVVAKLRNGGRMPRFIHGVTTF